jgi:hypothetical protein
MSSIPKTISNITKCILDSLRTVTETERYNKSEFSLSKFPTEEKYLLNKKLTF